MGKYYRVAAEFDSDSFGLKVTRKFTGSDVKLSVTSQWNFFSFNFQNSTSIEIGEYNFRVPIFFAAFNSLPMNITGVIAVPCVVAGIGIISDIFMQEFWKKQSFFLPNSVKEEILRSKKIAMQDISMMTEAVESIIATERQHSGIIIV